MFGVFGELTTLLFSLKLDMIDFILAINFETRKKKSDKKILESIDWYNIVSALREVQRLLSPI